MATRNLLGARLPIVAAPMAGGPTTVELAAAVMRAGGFAFLAAGYKTAEQMTTEISRLRALIDEVDETEQGRAFGVNVFVPSKKRVDESAFRDFAAKLQPLAQQYGITLDLGPVFDDDGWAQKLEALRQVRVPFVSFTFGLPERREIVSLQDSGAQVLATVTSVEEAQHAVGRGVDGIIVQGAAAGGHSAAFAGVAVAGSVGAGGVGVASSRHLDTVGLTDTVGSFDTLASMDTAGLVLLVREVTALPVIATGGVDGPESVQRLLAAGADAVAVGTLFLLSAEAGTSVTHRLALQSPEFTETALTRAFTGRPARALVNKFMREFSADAPDAYPAVHHLTRALRAAAVKAGDHDTAHLWAGTGYRAARPGSASEIVEWLSSRQKTT